MQVCKTWHNFDIPETWADELAPVDPDTCMNPGRKVIRYRAGGRLCVRPITSSWTGSPDDPRAASNKKLMVNDEEFDSPQDILPEEAEKLHGIPEGRTSGEGISAKQRLKCIGGGWDLRITRALLKHLNPRTPQAMGEYYTKQLKKNITKEGTVIGVHLCNLYNHNRKQYQN